MPVETLECDGGRSNLIVSRGVVSDQELGEFWKSHLTHDKERFKNYKYIILDHTELAL